MAQTLERYGWSPDVGPTPEFLWIPVDQIDVDSSYQRETSIGRSRRIASEFDWRKCGAVVVSKRDGRYYATDGGHRVLAIRLRPDLDVVPCLVFELAVEVEAASFVAMGKNRKNLGGLDLWKAQIRAGDPACLQAQSLCKRYGYDVKKSKRPDTIAAAQTLLKLNKRGCLEQVLYILRGAWPDSIQATEGTFIHGLGEFVAIYEKSESALPQAKMMAKLKKLDPDQLARQARVVVELERTSYAQAFKRAIMSAYNKGLVRERRLQSGG